VSWRIGVDIGGTFTDVALVDEAGGALAVVKVPTTPRDFGRGVIDAVATALRAHGVAPHDVTLLSHATTVVTNALLEGKGARTALVTTRGFRDVLELRRSARARLYDLFQDAPAVLVPRHLRLEVTERLDAQGDVVEPLVPADVEAAVDFLRAHRVEAVAVCLLFSFLNDAHERAIGARLRAALPGVPVFLSSEVLPEIREFERTSTTAVCAYVGPILASYLERLEAALGGMGLPPLYVMGSSGGVFTVAEGLRMPAMAVESGPAAGVIATAAVGRQLGRPNLISFDMGGTTAKASLIEGGAIKTTAEYEVGGEGNVSRWLHGTGHPIRVPVIDLAEVSAGGGSIAWIDPGGALRVGPESAGAEPGPVCYGLGGERPTVTDADLVLGYLNPVALLGGALKVHPERARAAIEAHVAGPLGVDVLAAAAGIVDVVNAGMAAALRVVSVERGYDPREFALVAFGGAGPVHAARLAQELEIPQVIVPPIPGGFSALGLVATDLRRDYARTFYAALAAVDRRAMAAAWEAMEETARAMLHAAGVPESRWEITRAADLRYGRQAYELTVPVASGPITDATLARLGADFHARHRMTYGHANPGEPVQLVNLRVSALGKLAGLTLTRRRAAAGGPPEATSRPVYFRETGLVACDVVMRESLAPGLGREGPLVVEAADTTIVVPPGWRLRVDDRGFVLLEAAPGTAGAAAQGAREAAPRAPGAEGQA
jgi:N-methylhydantoinase A